MSAGNRFLKIRNRHIGARQVYIWRELARLASNVLVPTNQEPTHCPVTPFFHDGNCSICFFTMVSNTNFCESQTRYIHEPLKDFTLIPEMQTQNVGFVNIERWRVCVGTRALRRARHTNIQPSTANSQPTTKHQAQAHSILQPAEYLKTVVS